MRKKNSPLIYHAQWGQNMWSATFFFPTRSIRHQISLQTHIFSAKSFIFLDKHVIWMCSSLRDHTLNPPSSSRRLPPLRLLHGRGFDMLGVDYSGLSSWDNLRPLCHRLCQPRSR